MKKLFLLTHFLFACICLQAQNTNAEATVRALDEKTMQAVMAKDTVALLKLWASDFTVNNPMNKVEKGGRNTLDRPVITQANFTSMVRNIEHVMVKGDVVILMGNEVVVPKEADGKAGPAVNRRFTNIWQKQGSEWRLIARHANNICAPQ